jgi:hypothetical protein
MAARTEPRDWNAEALRAMTEAQLQSRVLGLAKFYAWDVYHTHDSRRSNPGWPDLVLIKPPRVLFVELKTHRGSLRPEQRHWLQMLRDAGQEVAVWRPADLEHVAVRTLGHQQQRLTWSGAT